MPEEKLTPSILYTTEAEESKKKTEEELETPDPEESIAKKIIEENICDKRRGRVTLSNHASTQRAYRRRGP